uniref:Large ribosomal subunit protein bL32c n=1 Tax=Lagarostrobos franklinii TaxID=56892 RepID=A0A3T0ZD76_LAGFR|nr:ribosomal protein L32 [Lagarostrobos franklinii]BBF90829.1 ribosomal protein L32 [Lagarostrobos franklinii]
MAVPKKRTSKSRKRIRINIWKGKAYQAAVKAFSLAESISTGCSKSFYWATKDKPLRAKPSGFSLKKKNSSKPSGVSTKKRNSSMN